MKIFALTLLTLIWLAWPPWTRAELVVVVNVENPLISLSSRQLVDLYMGRSNSYPNGESAYTTDLPEQSQERDYFYRTLVGKSSAQVNAYWARLLFTGKSEPPQTVRSSADVIALIKQNKNAIAYISKGDLVHGLKVVYKFEDSQ
ncbi:hypothetical protein [Grimontia sp. NTOU-MAR1]|uniref:hypothetical protein n=1 Tax=Grimontia sp. NTOU-MAR1 TaxID=3111011 RepID=UPI002DBF918A|nr:hypothetical protein [Grimontia sp. NTOU-MAR1]WRV98209.1 hypothetical protein VP504_01880 [Grimontia sp. NTOU-MAR1]